MTNIIFDFDGTLVNSLPVAIEIYYELVPQAPRVTEQDIKRLRKLPAREIIKQLQVPLHKVPGLLMKGRAALAKRMDEIKLFDGVTDVIDSKDEQTRFFIMSSNSETNVRRTLRANSIEDVFEAVDGGVGLFSKASALKKLIKAHRLDKSDTYYIGDETRDIEAAKKIGLKCVAVTWGYNDAKILATYKPDFIANTPAELKQTLARKQ